MLELGFCLFAENDLRARSFGKLDVTADKIGVQMRFDNVFDALPVGFGFRQILLNIALRVNNRRFLARTDVIRSVRQAAEIKLFEIHNNLFFTIITEEFPLLWIVCKAGRFFKKFESFKALKIFIAFLQKSDTIGIPVSETLPRALNGRKLLNQNGGMT